MVSDSGVRYALVYLGAVHPYCLCGKKRQVARMKQWPVQVTARHLSPLHVEQIHRIALFTQEDPSSLVAQYPYFDKGTLFLGLVTLKGRPYNKKRVIG